MPVKVVPEREAKLDDAKVKDVAIKENGVVAETDKKEYLTGRDNMFLIMEDEYHNMNVSGLYYFNRRIDPADMRAQIGHFADSFGRCKQKVVRPEGLLQRPYWTSVEDDYDLDNHFTRVQMSTGTEEELMELAGPLIAKHMDFSKPLWHCYWFDGLDGGEKSVILYVVHHAIADGQGFVRTFLTYVASLDPSIGDISKLQYSAGRNMPKGDAMVPAADKKKKSATVLSRLPNHKAALSFVQKQMFVMIALMYGLALYLINIILYLSTFRKSYSRPVKTNKKQTAWTHAVSLEDVKKVKNHFKVTVNDVLTACVGAAFDGHLAKHDAPRDSRLWFLIPTSMRAATDFSTSNKTSGYILRIPNGPKVTLEQRMKAVHTNMKKGKSSPEAVFNYFPQDLFYRYPNAFPSIFKAPAKKLHGVLTNVPGPSVPLKWGTGTIDAMVAFIPQAMPNSVSCSVYTYQGHVTLSVNMDLDEESAGLYGPKGALSITKEFEKAFESLLKVVDTAAAAEEKKAL